MNQQKQVRKNRETNKKQGKKTRVKCNFYFYKSLLEEKKRAGAGLPLLYANYYAGKQFILACTYVQFVE